MKVSLKAFTLLEVLIAISILALVGSFVYPSVSKTVSTFQTRLEAKKLKEFKKLDDFCIFLGGKKGCFLER